MGASSNDPENVVVSWRAQDANTKETRTAWTCHPIAWAVTSVRACSPSTQRHGGHIATESNGGSRNAPIPHEPPHLSSLCARGRRSGKCGTCFFRALGRPLVQYHPGGMRSRRGFPRSTMSGSTRKGAFAPHPPRGRFWGASDGSVHAAGVSDGLEKRIRMIGRTVYLPPDSERRDRCAEPGLGVLRQSSVCIFSRCQR